MAYTYGTAANYTDLLSLLATFASGVGATILRQDTSNLSFRLPGALGNDKIYCNINAFENASNGYYNWELTGSVFFKSAFATDAQPGNSTLTWSVYAYFWNSQIPYWFFGDAERVIVVAKVGTVYQHVYLGFIEPVGTLAQYPYPLFIGGSGPTEAVAYSTTGQSAYWVGTTACSGKLYLPGGTWGRVNWFSSGTETSYTVITRPDCHISALNYVSSDKFLTAPDGSYLLEPILIRDRHRQAIYGKLNRVYKISGYNNASENIITVDGVNYMVFQDTYYSAYNRFCAIRMN